MVQLAPSYTSGSLNDTYLSAYLFKNIEKHFADDLNTRGQLVNIHCPKHVILRGAFMQSVSVVSVEAMHMCWSGLGQVHMYNIKLNFIPAKYMLSH